MRITIDVNINAAGLIEALRSFAGIAASQYQPLPDAPAESPTMPDMPAAPQTPAPVALPAQAAAPAAVPTSGQAYTMDQLAVAATSIIDAGRRQEVVALLNQFGVTSLMALPKEHYGAFATALRGMGAKI